MVNPELAGGALLDLGPYSISWCFQVALACGAQIDSTKVVSATKMYPTGVDETPTMILTFPRDEELGGDVHAIATASMRVSMNSDDRGTVGPCVRIQGDRGELQVFVPSYRPTRTRLVLSSGEVDDKTWEYPGPGKESGWYNGFGELNAEGEGHGMFWEADEAAMALVDGGKEGRLENLNEVLKMMEAMEEVQGKRQSSSFAASVGNIIVRALNNVGRKHTRMM